MDKIKNFTIIGLFITVIILLLLRQCNPIVTKENNTSKKDTVITLKSDTIIDTVRVTKIITKFKPSKIDTVFYSLDSIKYTGLITTYIDSLVDSNLVIRWKDVIKGEALQKHLDYKLFIPKKITNTYIHTITEYKDKYIHPKFQMFAGLELGGNQTQFSNIKPYLGVNIKKTQLTYGYNLLNNTHNIGVGYILFKK